MSSDFKVLFDPTNWHARGPNAARRQYWKMLRAARSTFLSEFPHSQQESSAAAEFDHWLLNTYGIKITYDRDGKTTDEISVVDEHKYLIFQLKFL